MSRRMEPQAAAAAPAGVRQASASRRRTREFRVRCLMLFSVCLSTLSDVAAQAADPHPLIPPLAFCSSSTCPCNIRTGVCIPYIPACDPAIDGPNAGPAWNLTLQEAINTALSNSEAVRNLGLVEAGSRNDLVRSVITTYDPMEAYARASAEWGIFDPLFTAEMVWDKFDIPPGTSFSGIGNRPPQLDSADAYASLEQLLPLGTRVRVDAVTNYLFNPQNPPGLDPNPQYFSYHQVGVSQPLLRGFGVDVTMAPIKIACAQAERTDWQFKQEILAMVRSIETTYWALYAQQENLKAIDQVLPYFQEVVRLRQEQARDLVGAESEVARAESEMYLYQQRRLETLAAIAENQLVLRNLMGVPPDDCRGIDLLAVPSTTRPFETLQSAVSTAINSRPDVLRQRLAVYIASQERLVAENVLQPQLDLNGYYRTNGLGENLDESYESKDSNNFNDWHMGVFFQVPLGRRQGRSQLRAAELRISRERALLDQTAHQASYEVADAYRRLHWAYQQLETVGNRQRAVASTSAGARATFDNPPAGMTTVFALEMYLQNLRNVADASISRNMILADYNSALARLEEVKGTLLQNRMIEVAGDLSDTLPAKLPPAEITMPESTTPLPSTPAPAPPVQAPAPAPVPPQGIVAPPSTPIVEQPWPSATPSPLIELPQPLEETSEAYADAAITPTPAQPIASAPQPASEPKMEVAQELPRVMSAPVEAPSVQMPQSVQVPQSTVQEPAYTAMLPSAEQLPSADESFRLQQPAAAMPFAAAPMPAATMQVERAPAVEKPIAVHEPAPQQPTRRLALQMPEMLMPSTTQPPAITHHAANPSALAKAPQASLRMPASVQSPAQPAVLKPQQKSVMKRKPAATGPGISLQMPNSVQGHRPASPDSVSSITAEQSGEPLSLVAPQLQLPNSVLAAPANSEGG